MANAPSGLKGNPASHRMGNANLKAKRQRCWLNGEKRKDARRKAQAERERINNERRQHGDKTPWEISQHNRNVRREIRRRAEAAASRIAR